MSSKTRDGIYRIELRLGNRDEKKNQKQEVGVGAGALAEGVLVYIRAGVAGQSVNHSGAASAQRLVNFGCVWPVLHCLTGRRKEAPQDQAGRILFAVDQCGVPLLFW